MRGLKFLGDKHVEVQTFDKPEPSDDELLISLKSTGICGSDLNYIYRTPKEKMDGYVHGVWVSSKVIPGHEPTGIVEETGKKVTNFKPGDNVIVHHVSGCGKCKQCKAGMHMHCESDEKKTYGFDIDGGFADYMVAKERDCVPLPNNLSFEEGSYLSCGAGTAFKAVKRLNITGFDTVSVFGLGPVGLAAGLLSKIAGATVIGVDPIKVRRDLAKEAGMDFLINPKESDPVKLIKDYTNNEGTSIGIECSSNPTARSQILDAAKVPGAKVAYVGEGGNVDINVSNQIIHKHLTLMGSWIYSIPELIEFTQYVARENINISQFITDRYNIEEAKKALAKADSGETGKVVFTW